MRDDAVICSAVRTPIGEAGRSLAPVAAWDLATLVAREAIARAGADPAALDEVIVGETVGGGGGAGRYVGLAAGVPVSVPGLTVVRACATGLEAITQAATAVRAGLGDLYLAAGVESMSNQPFLMERPQAAYPRRPPRVFVAPPSHPPALADLSVGINVGESSAERFGITREEQDEWALRSHRLAVAAQDAGRFDQEIVAVAVPQRRGDPLLVERDERPRRDTTLEALAKLPPVYKEGGTVTAGNSSGVNDAAAALVVASARRAEALGLRPRAVIRGWAAAGVDPAYTGTGPIEAVPKALARAGTSPGDVELVELNEAFASQTIACVRELDFDPERVNVNGGAIALGHPVGATGARLVVTLLHELERRGARLGVATMCAGGGLGMAAVIERV